MNRTWAVRLGVLAAASLSVGIIAGCQKTEAPKAAESAAAAAPVSGAEKVTTERLLNAANEPQQWMTYNGTYSEQRYSTLSAINKDTVKNLSLAWFADYDTNLTQAGTPLAVDGAIYVSTAWSKVYAFDARTGKQLWQYNPQSKGERVAQNVCCGIVNRGIAAYNGKIYVGTLDGRLVAIDSKTGKPVWEKMTIDETWHYSITSAPRVAKGKVFIGNSGGEYGVRGYIGAYDAETGEPLWRFYTVPGDPSKPFENEAMKKAAKTWGGDWWKLGGGGTVWDSIVYDPKTDLLYFGTGNGTPWNQRKRDKTGGDNLYLASIIAVKADTGEYVWHYQEVPGDTWDYDAVSPMMTVDMQIDGKEQHVIVQPSKNGFFYILEAATGKLLRAEPFTEVNWADGVDMKTGRPRVKKEARYSAGKPWNLAPGVQGAHGWQSNAYDPTSGIIYVPTQLAYFPMVEDPNYKPSPVGYNLGIDFAAQFTFFQTHPEAKRGFTGYLQAIDLATGKQLWKSEMNEVGSGGALATAGGVVFQGGGPAKEFRAFDSKTGEKLWRIETQTSSQAAPITYEVDGTQYVAVSVGGAAEGGYFAPNYSRLLVFKIGGTVTLPPTKDYTPPPIDPPANFGSAEIVKTGLENYGKYCAACHGDRGQTRGANFPDLTRTPFLHSQEGFDDVVLKGVRAEKGMASFANVLKPEDTVAIRAYLTERANELKNAPPPGGPPPPRTGNQHEQ